ncbi:hypothetical protein [Paenibacillus sp. GCM10012303]|uniref:hypothetical protein n=1 Tax=Paenibacillus sp. GCM10012303 TaxID=3317340 RepID=UPI003620057C
MSTVSKFFYLENGVVYRMEVFAQFAFGSERQVAFTSVGAMLATVGTPIDIEVEWQKFDQHTATYVTDTTRSDVIHVFDGTATHALTPVNGKVTLEYMPTEPGEVTFTSIGATHTLKVTVME